MIVQCSVNFNSTFVYNCWKKCIKQIKVLELGKKEKDDGLIDFDELILKNWLILVKIKMMNLK